MTGLLAAAFCYAGAMFAADNPFESAENEIYNGRFTSEKVDLRLEQSENKETGDRFFVGDLRINGISHLVLARGANGALIGTMGEIENQADGKKEFSNGASFRFMFQKQENGKYLLQIGENEASQVLTKQTFPKLETFYRGKGNTNLYVALYPKADDPRVYTGAVGFKGKSIPFTSAVSAGVLQGAMSFSDKTTNSFIIESNTESNKNSLVFITGAFKDELVIPTGGKEPTEGTKSWTVELNDKVSLNMIGVKKGTFMMGSPANEVGRESDETQHKVTLTKGFWLGECEVTQEQYEAVMGTNPSHFKGGNLPVEQVSYEDALAFCRRLTEKERAAGRLSNQYEYTLPTEAQWEYACRAGTTTALNNGTDNNFDEVAWYGSNGSGGNAGGVTHPVRDKKPNAWGFYDMHGNVWEWCLDWYGAYPTTAETDPTGASTGSGRVIRGGSWWNVPSCCRSADRLNIAPGDRNSNVGFRVCLSYSSNP